MEVEVFSSETEENESERESESDNDFDESMESSESPDELSISERLRNNDADVTSIQVRQQDLNDIVEPLETNSVVDSIALCVMQNETENVDFTPMYNHIRSRQPLRKLMFRDMTLRHDISHFLEAASENSALEGLDIRASTTFTPQSLGRLRSHPGLKKFCCSIMETEPTESFQIIKEIIETCPNLEHLKIFGGKFSRENWKPIQEALCTVTPEITLTLQCCYFDEDATDLFQSFLHHCPNPVRLRFHVPSLRFHEMDSSWLSQLVGPSVRAVKLNYAQIADDFGMDEPDIEQFMNSLIKNKNNTLKVLEFKKMSAKGVYHAIVNSIPYLSSLEEIKIGIYPFHMRDDSVVPVKEELSKALIRNISITQFSFNLVGPDMDYGPYWEELDDELLQSLRQRNTCIPGLVSSPDTIPLSYWPHVIQAMRKTTTGTSLIFQSLRGLTFSLPVSCGNVNDC